MRKKDAEKFFNTYAEIGKRISYFRNLRGLSQEELASKIDVSTSHLSKIEAPNIAVSFSFDMLLLISEGLEIPIAAFFAPIDTVTIKHETTMKFEDIEFK